MCKINEPACGTDTTTEVIKEWVLAAEKNNNVDKDINRAVTLNCIRCQGFDPYRVYDCMANGCVFHNFRLKGLMLDKE